jgi:hypothetical protein
MIEYAGAGTPAVQLQVQVRSGQINSITAGNKNLFHIFPIASTSSGVQP